MERPRREPEEKRAISPVREERRREVEPEAPIREERIMERPRREPEEKRAISPVREEKIRERPRGIREPRREEEFAEKTEDPVEEKKSVNLEAAQRKAKEARF